MEQHKCDCLHFRSVPDALLFVVYMAISICMPVFNYYVFTSVFKEPVTFTFVQFLFCALAALAWNCGVKVGDNPAVTTKISDKQNFGTKILLFAIPGVLLGANVSLNNLGLAKTSATLSILIKATSGIWTVLLDLALFRTRPPKWGFPTMLLTLAGSALIGVSAFLYNPYSKDQLVAIVMLCVSTVLGCVYTLAIKRAQRHLREKRNLKLHGSETSFIVMGMASVVMLGIGLVIEPGAFKELFGELFDLENLLLLTLAGGCLMTTTDKLCSIFLMLRNTIVDWQIIQDSKTVPKIVLDVLLNNKYPFDVFSISGGLVIIAAEIIWSVISPGRKAAGEGLSQRVAENEPLVVRQEE